MSTDNKLSEKDKSRFWSKVDKRGKDDCWPWKAAHDQKGYGKFWFNNALMKASRFAAMLAGNPIPDGRGACHTCDNPPCVNPAHIFAGTQADNVSDMAQKNRILHGEKHGSSKLSIDDVRNILLRKLNGESSKSIAETFGIHPGHVWALWTGRWRRRETLTLLAELKEGE